MREHANRVILLNVLRVLDLVHNGNSSNYNVVTNKKQTR